MSVTRFNDSPDFVEIAIFNHQRNLFCLPRQKRFFLAFIIGFCYTFRSFRGRICKPLTCKHAVVGFVLFFRQVSML